MTTINTISSVAARFPLPAGAGSDAVHTNPEYGYAVTRLHTANQLCGYGISFTLGAGTQLVCDAIELLAQPLVGCEIDELMSRFGAFQKELAEHPQLRWLGPHKGVLHLALGSITNACFDLWARARKVPLWKLLLDLDSKALVNLLDLSYLEDEFSPEEVVVWLDGQRDERSSREAVLQHGYPGYDTSVGWFDYPDQQIRENALRAVDAGFGAIKLKVGSPDMQRDLRRVGLVRDAVGPDIKLMLDANQAWSLPTALSVGSELATLDPFWIEEPTQPDDILAHRQLAHEWAPIPIAVGESIPNRVIWKNYLRNGAVGIVQADCTRLAGISEYLAVSIMATHYPVQIIPHVGDMGQIHQHLVLFNHIALGHDVVLLEHIPHLRDRFVVPVRVEQGHYTVPQEPGTGAALKIAMADHV